MTIKLLKTLQAWPSTPRLALLLTCAASAPAWAGDFGADLYGRFASSVPAQDNVVFSPESIRTALGMAYAGSRGETRKEFERTLSLPQGPLARQFPRRHEPKPVGPNDPPEFTYSVANSLWVPQGRPLNPGYVAELRSAFGAVARETDFGRPATAAGDINEWVSAATRKKIPQLVSPESLSPNLRAVLVNAVYFKADWVFPFEPTATQPGKFHREGAAEINAPLMTLTKHLRYAESGGVQVVELPYRGGGYSMRLLLPSKGKSLDSVTPALPALLGSKLALASRRVSVTLPKFKFGFGRELGADLQALGLRRAFNAGQADFGGMRPDSEKTMPLWISAVIHKAVIEVDEKGTEAAAATAVGMEGGAMPLQEERVEFRADHPFVFAIREDATGRVLFLGRVVDPVAGVR